MSMPRYEEIDTEDPNYSLLRSIEATTKQIYVTYTEIIGSVRKLWGHFKSFRSAWKGCRRANAKVPGSAPLCFMLIGTKIYRAITDNEFTH